MKFCLGENLGGLGVLGEGGMGLFVRGCVRWFCGGRLGVLEGGLILLDVVLTYGRGRDTFCASEALNLYEFGVE